MGMQISTKLHCGFCDKEFETCHRYDSEKIIVCPGCDVQMITSFFTYRGWHLVTDGEGSDRVSWHDDIQIEERKVPSATLQESCDHEFKKMYSLTNSIVFNLCSKCMLAVDEREMTEEEAEEAYNQF